MSVKATLIDLLAKTVMELPEKNEATVRALLEENVGPLCDDSAALAAAKKALEASQSLNDQAEVLCDKLIKKWHATRDVTMLVLHIDTVWSRLEHTRKQQKRELTVTD